MTVDLLQLTVTRTVFESVRAVLLTLWLRNKSIEFIRNQKGQN